MSRHTRSVLARAAFGVLYANKEGDGAAGGGDDKSDKDKGDKGKVKESPKLELTQAELDSRTQSAIDAALKKERDDAAAAKKKADDEAATKKAKEDGDLQTLADNANKSREEAETKASAAERRAQLAEVNIQLRDAMAADETLKPFLANATDIMLHVEKKLAADAKPEDITKIITAEAKAFVERTGAAKGAANGASAGAGRGKLPAGSNVAKKPETNGQPRTATPSRMF